MDKNQEINIHERVARLEVSAKTTDDNVKLILTNHLPHLEANVIEARKDFSDLKSQLSYYAGIGVAIVTILNIIVNVIIKLWK